MAQNSNVSRSQEDYITQVAEEIEGIVSEKLSQEFRRTENRILGALARLDDFRMNPLLQRHSRTTPEASRDALSTRQGTNEEDSQNDPHPEAGSFHSQMMQNSGPEDGHDKTLIIWNSIIHFVYSNILISNPKAILAFLNFQVALYYTEEFLGIFSTTNVTFYQKRLTFSAIF